MKRIVRATLEFAVDSPDENAELIIKFTHDFNNWLILLQDIEVKSVKIEEV